MRSRNSPPSRNAINPYFLKVTLDSKSSTPMISVSLSKALTLYSYEVIRHILLIGDSAKNSIRLY